MEIPVQGKVRLDTWEYKKDLVMAKVWTSYSLDQGNLRIQEMR